MRRIIKPIALEEASFQVVLLHKALAVLGLPPTSKEVAERTAGNDTLSKVRELQRRLELCVDESMVVDDATCAAIVTALRDRGLSDAHRSFTVSGTVRRHEGSIQRQQRLLAFDLALRGVATCKTVRTVGELTKEGGFEFLGEACSDTRGAYQIEFYDWMYSRAERKLADVVVFAVEPDRDGRILGRSQLVSTTDHSTRRTVTGLDVHLDEGDRATEHETLMTSLDGFLRESRVSLVELAKSPEQLTFCAKDRDLALSQLTVAADAALRVLPASVREGPVGAA